MEKVQRGVHPSPVDARSLKASRRRAENRTSIDIASFGKKSRQTSGLGSSPRSECWDVRRPARFSLRLLSPFGSAVNRLGVRRGLAPFVPSPPAPSGERQRRLPDSRRRQLGRPLAQALECPPQMRQGRTNLLLRSTTVVGTLHLPHVGWRTNKVSRSRLILQIG